jgi:hypothetical protein
VEDAHGTNENDVRSTIVRREIDLPYGGHRRSLHRVESAPDQSRGASPSGGLLFRRSHIEADPREAQVHLAD